MSTQLQNGVLYLIVIGGMLLAIRQLSGFVARRSPRREQMLWIGAGLLVIGQLILAWYDTSAMAPNGRGTTAILSHSIGTIGYIWVVYGCIGWDRASLNVIPWRHPLIASCLIGVTELALMSSWEYRGGGASLIAQGLCILLLNVMFIRHAIAYRKGKVLPFIGLHLFSTIILLTYQYQHIDQRITPDALAMTSVSNVVLFVIVTWMLASSQRQQRMIIV